jgi:hypothetical protein
MDGVELVKQTGQGVSAHLALIPGYVVQEYSILARTFSTYLKGKRFMSQAPKDYTARFKGSAGASRSTGTTGAKGPDKTIHHPPIILIGLGLMGFIAGIITNIWQMFTTFIALWAIINGVQGNATLNWGAFWQKQPTIAAICLLIAFCAQLFLQFLVFRLDSAWKTQVADGKAKSAAMLGATVQIVQQTDLVTLISILALVIDTVGDYTFVSLYTSNIFIIFAYAVALYGLSTLGFVRSIEYLWAGFAAMYGKGKSA